MQCRVAELSHIDRTRTYHVHSVAKFIIAVTECYKKMSFVSSCEVPGDLINTIFYSGPSHEVF